METQLYVGAGVLERLGSSLDELHDATRTPMMARRPWLSTWARCYRQHEPLAVAVVGPGRLEAVALLGRRRRHGFDEFAALGCGPSDQARLPARSPEAAAALAVAVIDHLTSTPGRWRLIVRHLPQGDRVARQIADGLEGAELVPGDVSPALRFGPNRSPSRYVSRNHAQQVRRMMNRMRREGLTPVIAHLREEAEIRQLLPQVEDVCRQRDLELRGQSLLDHPGTGCFFRHVILEHASRGEVVLTTVQLAGQLAAYVLCFVDHGVRRMWSCRLSPSWARYGAGRLGNDAALRHALADPGCTEFDWMRGDEPYKSSMSNHVERAQDLLVWSSPGMKVVLDLRRRVRGSVKRVVSRHEWLRPAVRATRRLEATGRRRWRGLFFSTQGRRE